MARIRSIKPGFFTDDFIAELEPIERLFFIGLFTQADRNGRLEDRPRRLKAQILPFDDADTDKILNRLNAHSERFIIRYEIDGKRYIQIRTFELHQKPHHKEPDSVLPALDKLETSVSTPNKDGVKTVPTPSQSVYRGGFSLSRSLSCKQPLVRPRNEDAPKEEPILTFLCSGDKSEWHLYPSKEKEWQASFPGLIVLNECKKARQWILDNPTKRKTHNGMTRFLGAWLGRVQNSGGSNAKSGNGGRIVGGAEPTEGKYDDFG